MTYQHVFVDNVDNGHWYRGFILWYHWEKSRQRDFANKG